MSDEAAVAARLSEVREVVETFRRYKIVVPDWAQVIASAVEALESLMRAQVEDRPFADVATELRRLLSAGLPANTALVERIAEDTAELIKWATPAGIPAPEDENWAFPKVTSA